MIHDVHEQQEIRRRADVETERRRAMAVVQAQAATIPSDGNIGPSRHGGPTTLAAFRRRLVIDGLRATWRNLQTLRESDDDPALGRLAIDLIAWEEELRKG